jgi:outer membrane protein assembly factor BamB
MSPLFPSNQPGTVEDRPVESLARTWELAAWVSGVFSLLVGAMMLIGHLNTPTLDPLKSPQLKELKTTLRQNPTDETVKQQIRELDLQLRRKYFRQMTQIQSGVYLLLGGVVVFVISVARFSSLRRRLPMPRPRPESGEQNLRAGALARWSVAATGASVGCFLFLISSGMGTALPEGSAEIEKALGTPNTAAAETPDAASPEEMQQNWPRFRGPGGFGISNATNAPIKWDAKTGEGIAWKTPVLAKGFNSPIIWGNRVFYSGGDANLREVFCEDLKTGDLLWRRAITNVPGNPAQPPEIPESTGYAACSMATDGRRVYASFANGDLAALTLEGKPVWSKGFGALKNPYGHATSLTTWRDRVIVQLDQGEAEERKSRLYAIDGRTGQVVWQKERKTGSSWATPIVIEAAGKAQIITLAIPAVVAYAAADGTELWRVESLSGEITPSPAFGGGQVIVASPSDKLIAIRPDGQGDVTKTHAAWTNEDNVPDITSPVSNGELVFTVTTSGMLTCLDAKDGKKQWEHDYDFECHASPTLVGQRLYLLGQKGTAVAVEAGRQFKELFRTEMGDTFSASPAFAQDRIVMRGGTNMWCIGKK